MADDPNERFAEFNPLLGPGPRNQPEAVPERSWGEALVDPVIGLGRGAVGAVKQAYGVGEAVASAIDLRGPAATTARKNIDTLSDIDAWMKSGQSQQNQAMEAAGGPSFRTDPGKYAVNVLTGMAPYVPLAMATGGWGAIPAFGALGFGQVRT